MKTGMIYKNVIGLIVIMSLLSCNNNDRVINEVKELMHRKISFPNGYEEFSCNSEYSLDNLLKQNVKVVTYMEDLSCTSCGVKTLKLWQKEIKEIDKNVAYIIVLHSDSKEQISDMTKTLSLDLPIMYYQTNIFEQKNTLEGILARNKTFLLDKENKIILVGEPFGKEKLSKLYKKTIDSLNVVYKKQ